MPSKSAEDPSNLLDDPLGPFRPTPLPFGTLINSRTYVGQFGLVYTLSNMKDIDIVILSYINSSIHHLCLQG